MKIVYGKELNREELSLIKSISLECGILFDTARLLYCRNIDTVEKVKVFLNPGKNRLYSPTLFSNINSIVSRIDYARQNGENVLICGDYDADGVCATAVLYNCLKEYGINVYYSIPEREDGYGLDLEKIEEICSDDVIDLIITVDCGISEREKIAELLDVGIDVIVTDHHEPPEELPDCLIMNPKVNGCGYPFDGLCGAGVAYKLGYALIGEKADKYLDYVALATVADSMDLIDENRSIVYEGLKLFNSSNLRLAFKQLLGDYSNKVITSQTLAYSLAPKINAGGRMGDANTSIRLLLASDENEIYNLSVKLNMYNIARQEKCDEIYKKAKEIINEKALYNKSAILVADESWGVGFIGIVASKLAEDYNKPVIVFAGHDGYYKGSARSVSNLNLYNAINEVKEYLITFGGHSQAAGVSVEKDNFELFANELCKVIDKTEYDKKDGKEVFVEWKIENEFSIRFAREINMFEPFGIGNRKPLFVVDTNKVVPIPLKKGSQHYSFDTQVIEMLNFNGEKDVLWLTLPVDKSLVFEVNYSVFKGREQVKGYLKGFSFMPFDFESVKEYVFAHELVNITRFKGKNFTKILTSDVVIKKGYGTMYAVSNPDALKDYNIPSDIKVSLFENNSVSCENCIVISPENFPEYYSRVIFLDKPPYIPDREGVFVAGGLNSDYLSLKTDRVTFGDIYSYLCSLDNVKMISSADTVKTFSVPFSSYQFIFTLETFIELGLFYNDDGRIKRDKNLKNALTNSVIYNTICNIVE